MIALCRRRQWLVLSILFLPFDFLVASSTNVLNGHGENGCSLFGFGIVMKGESVLMDRCMPFLLFLQCLILWHGNEKIEKIKKIELEMSIKKKTGITFALGCRGNSSFSIARSCYYFFSFVVFRFLWFRWRRIRSVNGRHQTVEQNRTGTRRCSSSNAPQLNFHFNHTQFFVLLLGYIY